MAHAEEYCAPFCAPSQQKTIANGSDGASIRIATTPARNQRYSSWSQLGGKISAATVNRRVASSNLALGAILLQFVQWFTTTPIFHDFGVTVIISICLTNLSNILAAVLRELAKSCIRALFHPGVLHLLWCGANTALA